MASIKQQYKAMLSKLFPKGQLWRIESDSTTAQLLEAFAEEFSRVEEAANKLLLEADPRYTQILLEEWESEYGLPDTCSVLAASVGLRREALLAKITDQGGQNHERYQFLIGPDDPIFITLGEPTTVAVQIPTPIKGVEFRHIWIADVPALQEEWFEADDPADSYINEINDPGYAICLINKLKPAHTSVIYV